MTLETLVSAVKQDVAKQAEKMNLQSDAVIINQCGENSYLEYEHTGCKIRAYSFAEKGVGLSRNNALLRAKARQAGIQDIRQKSGEVLFTLSNLNFEAVSALCADPDYKTRVTFIPNAKQPTLRLKLHSSADSLKQSKAFVERLQKYCQM